MLKLAKTAQGAMAAKLLAQNEGGICTVVAGAKALRHTGVKLYMTLDELIKFFPQFKGIPYNQISKGIWANELIPALKQLGARVRELQYPTSLKDVNTAAGASDGVILFAVKWKNAAFWTNPVVHTLYAFKNLIGQIRYADRSGRVVKNLAELDSLYPGIGKSTVFFDKASGVGNFIEVSGVSMIETVSGIIGYLALAVSGLVAMNMDAVNLPQLDKAFNEFKAAKGNPAPAPSKPGGTPYAVVKGDSLSAIAKKFYGDFFLWPVIYDANKNVIGSNWNVIKPVQQYVIPDIKQFSPSQITEFKNRGRNWK
jgi:LysM repeat protein